MIKEGSGIFTYSYRDFIIKKKVQYDICFLAGIGVLCNCNIKFMELLTDDEYKYFYIEKDKNEFDLADFLETLDFDVIDYPFWSIKDDQDNTIFSSEE
jgi:hypothetical protein